MSDFGLIYANLWRKGLRTSLLLFAIFIAFFIYAMLSSVHQSFYGSAGDGASERLVTINRINFTETMPLAYFNRVQAVEDVEGVTHASWFGGYYQEVTNFVQTFAVEPESYLELYPELSLPAEQRAAWLGDQSGIIIGSALARAYGWEVGDQLPLLTNIWQRDDGTYLWTFNVSGIFDSTDENAPTNYALLHYDYFNEPKAFARDTIGWMVIRPASQDAFESVADAIDTQFANSAFETETGSEDQFSQSFLEQLGNISLILMSVMGAAFAAILLIVGNTMVMTVRERTREIAVMKTLGFSSPRIFRIVLGESILLALIGGLLGVAAAAAFVMAIAGFAELILPGLAITVPIALSGVGIMVALGLLTGAAPAFGAMRLRIIDALGRG